MVDVIHLMRQCECEGTRLFSLFLPARPPLAGSLRLACLDLSPVPGRGMSRLLSICGCVRDTDLLASNHVMPLSRSCSFAVAVRFVLRCGAVCLVPCDLPRLLDCLGSSIARFL